MSGIVPDAPGGWEFTPEVAAEFDGHVTDSVPYYDQVQDLVAQLADWHAPDGATVADLGAATGTTCARIQGRHPGRALGLHLYDESAAMLDLAAERLPGAVLHPGDLRGVELDHPPAGMTLCLFTLQFFDPDSRLHLLMRARHAAAVDGVLVVAEKLHLPDAGWAETAVAVSHDYKAGRGVPAEEIRAKERALRGVLRPWTDEQNRAAISAAGWTRLTVLWRWHQWVLYGAYAREAGPV
ncbi:class I SAM-dependent methyltransferase [Parafrankia discariae]|uniref:hypothetical protein n=1 Tax=Parafrankia discariae TaxID=365528 RepID=UPI0003738A5E|nr:hypothetical protein [Parafrankia discariae]